MTVEQNTDLTKSKQYYSLMFFSVLVAIGIYFQTNWIFYLISTYYAIFMIVTLMAIEYLRSSSFVDYKAMTIKLRSISFKVLPTIVSLLLSGTIISYAFVFELPYVLVMMAIYFMVWFRMVYLIKIQRIENE
jgi:hypothetical protein